MSTSNLNNQLDVVSKALQRVWNLGQTYWQQSDSESISQNKKSEETRAKYIQTLEGTQSTIVSLNQSSDGGNNLSKEEAFNKEISRCYYGKDETWEAKSWFNMGWDASQEQKSSKSVSVADGEQIAHLTELIGAYGVQCSETKELAPTKELVDALNSLPRAHPSQPDLREVISVSTDLLAERDRQINVKGWSPEHDDDYTDGDLAYAATAYVFEAAQMARYIRLDSPRVSPISWPWSEHSWKPGTQRRNLVKAGALILAEITRLDRAKDREKK